MAPWDRPVSGSFFGEFLPYTALAAGAGLLIGCFVVLVSGEARSNPAFVILGSMLAGVGFMLIIGVLVLVLAVRGD